MYWSNIVYALLCCSEQLKTCSPLGFGQIDSDSLNRVPFIKSLNRQMLMNHDQGVEPVTMCLVCLRPSNMASVASDSIITLFWLIERIRSIPLVLRKKAPMQLLCSPKTHILLQTFIANIFSYRVKTC